MSMSCAPSAQRWELNADTVAPNPERWRSSGRRPRSRFTGRWRSRFRDEAPDPPPFAISGEVLHGEKRRTRSRLANREPGNWGPIFVPRTAFTRSAWTLGDGQCA